jgi:hypothetical protein
MEFLSPLEIFKISSRSLLSKILSRIVFQLNFKKINLWTKRILIECFTKINFGPTVKAVLLGKVQGVVVRQDKDFIKSNLQIMVLFELMFVNFEQQLFVRSITLNCATTVVSTS